MIGLEIRKYSYNWPFSIFQKYLISLLRVHLLGLRQGVEADTEGNGHGHIWGFLDLWWETVHPALLRPPGCTCLVIERPKYPFLKSFLLADTTKGQGLTDGLDQFPPVEPLRKHTPNHRNEEISGPLGLCALGMEPGPSLLLNPLICVQSIYHS